MIFFFRVRGQKQIRAILCENAFSAAYAIASATGRIYMPRTGGVGSIGIISFRYDVSKALAMAGIKLNALTFGERKADHVPELALSPEGRARFQADVNRLGNLFVTTVARNRNLAPSVVRGFQARTLLGAAGVQAGLADVIASPVEAMDRIIQAAKQERRKVLAR